MHSLFAVERPLSRSNPEKSKTKMKFKTIITTTAAIALSLTTAAQAANNNNAILFSSGYWRVIRIAHSDYGFPFCKLVTQISSTANSAIAYVVIGWNKGATGPYIHLNKTNWQFPIDLQIPFSITLDSGTHEFFGVARQTAKMLGTHVFSEVMVDDSWLEEFASSENMTVTFKGNEPKWTVKMAGSRAAEKQLRACVKGLSEETATTQSTSPVPNDDEPKKVQTVPIKPKGDGI
jgi:hypothetical protein